MPFFKIEKLNMSDYQIWRNQASHMLGIQILAFFHKKLLFFGKNLKIDNFLFSIKHKTTQNKELKYRRKNIVWYQPTKWPRKQKM